MKKIYDPYEPMPIAAYDVADKKLVAVFSSVHKCASWLHQGEKASNTRDISRMVRTKTRSQKNRFGRILCFRYATMDQVRLLQADEKLKILDNRYSVVPITV